MKFTTNEERDMKTSINTFTSKTITLCPGRIKRGTPVTVLYIMEYSDTVQCRNIETGKQFICDKSDLRYFEEAGA